MTDIPAKSYKQSNNIKEQDYFLVTIACLDELTEITKILSLKRRTKTDAINTNYNYYQGKIKARNVIAVQTNVGIANSAMNLIKAIYEFGKPKAIINIGTAGAISNYKPGSFHAVTTSLDIAMAINDFTRNHTTKILTTDAQNTQLSATVCGTASEFVKSDKLKKSLPQVNIVDMELYPQVLIANHINIPIHSFKVVSDNCSSSSEEDFKNNLSRVLQENKQNILKNVERVI